MTFRIGDIIEFKDANYRDGKWHVSEELQVGRVDRIIVHTHPTKDTDHATELWLEYYSEAPGRMYVAPEWVVRLVEPGSLPFPDEFDPPLKVGQRITFKDTIQNEEKTFLDEIGSVEVSFDKDGLGYQYHFKYSGYQMNEKEFEVCP